MELFVHKLIDKFSHQQRMLIKGKNMNNKKKIKKGYLGWGTRRDFLKGMGALSTSLFAGQTFSRAKQVFAENIPKQINIGTFGPSHCSVPFVYAKLKGFFKQDNLNINLINYPNMPLIAQNLISGKIDFGQLIVPLAFAMHSGAKPFSEATPIVIPQITGNDGAVLMVRKDTGIHSPLDFKKKTLANHSKLSVHFLINMMFLEKHGLNYQKDLNVKIVELGNIINATKDGQVDAFVMPEPKNAIAEKMGIANVFMLSRYLWQDHPCCCLVTKRETFEKNTEMVTAVTRTITKAGLLANDADTREETIDLIRSSDEYNFEKISKDVLMRAFIPGRADFYPFPYLSSAMLIIQEMKKYDLLDTTVNGKKMAEDVFLSDLSRSIIKDLGAAPPSSNYRTEKILGEFKNYSLSS